MQNHINDSFCLIPTNLPYSTQELLHGLTNMYAGVEEFKHLKMMIVSSDQQLEVLTWEKTLIRGTNQHFNVFLKLDN